MPAPHLPAPALLEPPGSFLFSDEIIQELTDQERKFGIYTAERCPPEKRQAIIELTVQNRSARWIASTIGVHQSTVTAVRDSPEGRSKLADIRSVMARKFQRVALDQAERLEQFPDLLPASSIPLAIKMLVETAELLDGKATSRVEHVERVDIFADFQAFCATLEMDAKNERLGIGDGGEKSALIAGGAADPGAIIDVPADLVEAPGCNSKLQGFEPIHEATAADATSLCYESKADLPAPVQATTPPGGGSTFVRPGEPATDNHTQNFWPNGSFEDPIEE